MFCTQHQQIFGGILKKWSGVIMCDVLTPDFFRPHFCFFVLLMLSTLLVSTKYHPAPRLPVDVRYPMAWKSS